MTELLALTENLQTSRPVFRLTTSTNGRTIDANTDHPVYRYRPIPEQDNLLSELICLHYEERFNTRYGRFEVDKVRIANRAMEEIRNSMSKFLEKNLEMRNPRQSKVYRWYYRNLPNGSEFNDVLVMVYKYIRSFTDSDMKAENIEHINNAIALLDAIMEKYDEQR